MKVFVFLILTSCSFSLGIREHLYSGGFIDYNDLATATTPVSVSADTWTTIPNDGLGTFTNLKYMPNGITKLMDNSTGQIDPSELNLGDVILIRNDYTITPNNNNAKLEFRYVLGVGGSEYTLSKQLVRLDAGSGVPYRFALGVDQIYMGDENTRDNKITLQVRISSTADLENAGTVISVLRYRK